MPVYTLYNGRFIMAAYAYLKFTKGKLYITNTNYRCSLLLKPMQIPDNLLTQ